MPRTISSDVLAELVSTQVAPAFFAAIQFTSGVSYVWTGLGTITWNGHDWLGLGAVGQISGLRESSNGAAQSRTLSLLTPNDLLSKAIGETNQSYAVELWFGLLNRTTGAIIADPLKTFRGYEDTLNIDEGPEQSVITLTVESDLLGLQRPVGRRYTHEDQQFRYPGDRGFEYVNGLQQWDGVWGKPGNSVPTRSGNTGSSPAPHPTGGGGRPGGGGGIDRGDRGR